MPLIVVKGTAYCAKLEKQVECEAELAKLVGMNMGNLWDPLRFHSCNEECDITDCSLSDNNVDSTENYLYLRTYKYDSNDYLDKTSRV